jgi:hypothetical protein
MCALYEKQRKKGVEGANDAGEYIRRYAPTMSPKNSRSLPLLSLTFLV